MDSAPLLDRLYQMRRTYLALLAMAKLVNISLIVKFVRPLHSKATHLCRIPDGLSLVP
jgi:hypothetical protein